MSVSALEKIFVVLVVLTKTTIWYFDFYFLRLSFLFLEIWLSLKFREAIIGKNRNWTMYAVVNKFFNLKSYLINLVVCGLFKKWLLKPTTNNFVHLLSKHCSHRRVYTFLWNYFAVNPKLVFPKVFYHH